AFNAKYVAINAAINAIRYGIINASKFGSCTISGTSNMVVPKLTGIYNRNEKRSAVSCCIPTSIDTTIEAPERLMPGVTATARASPTITASLEDKSQSFILHLRFRIIQITTDVL